MAPNVFFYAKVLLQAVLSSNGDHAENIHPYAISRKYKQRYLEVGETLNAGTVLQNSAQ